MPRRKKDRNRSGSVLVRERIIGGKLVTVYDARKRYYDDNGRAKELFKRCRSREEAERELERMLQIPEVRKAHQRLMDSHHGHTSKAGKRKISLTYQSYLNAKARCNDPNQVGYEYYGGRGIEFRFASFKEFLAALGERTDRKLTVDRKDPNGHYEKGNVRWATKKQQAENQRTKQVH